MFLILKLIFHVETPGKLFGGPQEVWMSLGYRSAGLYLYLCFMFLNVIIV